MSPAQNAILELKLVAIGRLSYEDYLLLLGETEDSQQKRYCQPDSSYCITNITHFIINSSYCIPHIMWAGFPCSVIASTSPRLTIYEGIQQYLPAFAKVHFRMYSHRTHVILEFGLDLFHRSIGTPILMYWRVAYALVGDWTSMSLPFTMSTSQRWSAMRKLMSCLQPSLLKSRILSFKNYPLKSWRNSTCKLKLDPLTCKESIWLMQEENVCLFFFPGGTQAKSSCRSMVGQRHRWNMWNSQMVVSVLTSGGGFVRRAKVFQFGTTSTWAGGCVGWGTFILTPTRHLLLLSWPEKDSWNSGWGESWSNGAYGWALINISS